jgi:type IV pilus assembly protein PilM
MSLFKKDTYPIGIDLSSKCIKMAQLSQKDKGVSLVAIDSVPVPDQISSGSVEWQRWVIKAIKKIHRESDFKGKTVHTSLPSSDIYIDQLKINKTEDDIENAIFEKIKPRISFSKNDAVIKYVLSKTENSNGKADVMVMATEKLKIDHHLAIYEQAGLEVKSLSLWPFALTSSYTGFFGRRDSDLDLVILIVDICPENTNVVIAKHSALIFARTINIGSDQLSQGHDIDTFATELNGCVQYYETVCDGSNIQKLLLTSGSSIDAAVCEKVAEIAKQMHVPAQIGDVLAAVNINDDIKQQIKNSGRLTGWASAFGLSLLQK